MVKRIILLLILIFFSFEYAITQESILRKQGKATQLLVNNKSFLILGGELGNSSASSSEDIERIFPKLQKLGLNTVLVPAYWDLVEPVEGKFDFTLTDKAIKEARRNNLKIVFLWFGVWKNSMSCYAPFWFKENYDKYPRGHTQNGKPLEIASAFSENVYQADNRAFSQWLEHIATIDKENGTVIMIQIENEIGMLEDARDYSQDANTLFNTAVPQELLNYLNKNRKNLHPQMLSKWKSQGCKMKGNWQEVFGTDIYTDELFMAWHYACYVEKMAKTARAIYNIPLYVNTAMNSRNRIPGEYPSAGPLAHLIDIWHCGAPNIDFLAPDIYDDGFTDWVKKYNLHNNPLFIPEAKLTDNDGVRAFYVFGEHDAIGFSPFSIEDYPDSATAPLIQSYSKLKELMPLLTEYQGKGVMKGLLFDENNKERIIKEENLKLICHHYYTLPWDPRAKDGNTWPEGGGIIIKLNPKEYIIAGSGIVIEFKNNSETKPASPALGEDGFTLNNREAHKNLEKKENEMTWNGRKRIGIGSVDEIKINKDTSFSYIRRLNGDQDHQGRHVRIPIGQFSILHVKLYEYK